MAQGTPNFAITPKLGVGTVTTGDTSRTNPTLAVNVYPAGANGSRIERIVLTPIGPTVASCVRLFLYDGTNFHLYKEVALGAATTSGSVPVTTQTLEAVTTPNLFPLLLPQGWSLQATVNDTQTSSGVNVIAVGGDF